MSELTTKIKNNPNSFAKESDFSEELYAFKLKPQVDGGNAFSPPKNLLPFDNSGTGGIPLLHDNQKHCVYVDHSDKHSLIIGATGSKKSRLLAMPLIRTLGAAGETMIVSDPKAEIYNRTSKYLRDLGYDIVVINLREPNYGSAWNPLAVPYQWFLKGDEDRAYEFANDIAVNLTSVGKSDTDPFWDNSAGSFFFGLILLLFKYCRDEQMPIESVNIGNIIQLRNALCAGDSKSARGNIWWNYAKTDNFIASTLIGTVETANETRAGILSVFDQKMRSLAIQPSLLSMLSDNDISYETIAIKPSAVFLIVPDEKTGYHGLVSLFVKQSYEFFVYRAHSRLFDDKGHGCRINYVLDVFSSLPTINDFPAMITAARSRNIRFNLFLQSKHQLKLRYKEEADTIMANCENWIFLTSREIDLLREISELCGDVQNSQQKPILTTSELQRLDKKLGEALVLHGRNKPFVSRLADIEEYDNMRTSKILPVRGADVNRKPWSQIDFFSQHVKNKIMHELPDDSPLKLSQGMPNDFNVDSLIKSIDSKIAELEKEEKSSRIDESNKSERE